MSKYLRYAPFVYLAALLPAMLLRDYTPANELRYLSIADEALREGHLFAFTNHGLPYADKPPLYLWLVMAGKYLWGEHYLLYLTMLSFLPALGIIRLMNQWVAESNIPRTKEYGELTLMSSGMFLGTAVFVRMDMLMSWFILLALFTFWQRRKGKISKKRCHILFPLFLFLAIFTKGPLGLLIPLVATVAYLIGQHGYREIPKFWGLRTWLPLLTALGLWFFLTWCEGGTPYLQNLLFHQTFGRAVHAFHHSQPFYYYLITYWYSLAPWSLLWVVVWVETRKQHLTLLDYENFFLTTALCTLVLLSVCSSKLAIYMLPAFPFIVYSAVSLLSRMKINRWIKVSVALPAVVFSLLPAAVILLPQLRSVTVDCGTGCMAAVAALTVAGIGSLVLLLRRKDLTAPIQTLTGGMMAAVFFFGLSFPKANSYFGYRDVCRQAAAVAKASQGKAYYTWHVRRSENMDVFLGQSVQDVSDRQVLSGACRGGVLIVQEKDLKKNAAICSYLSRYKGGTGRYRIIVVH